MIRYLSKSAKIILGVRDSVFQVLVCVLYQKETQTFTNQLSIMGVIINNITMYEAIHRIADKLDKRQQELVYFVNADCLNKVFIDKDYYNILINNKMNLPDGSGISLAAKMLGSAIKENVNGTDMLPHLCRFALRNEYRIYLLGAAPGVAMRMKTRLELRYPGILICGTSHGYFDFDTQADNVIEDINVRKTDILLVAFGAPLQERFIHENKDRIDAPVMIGVGGLFDFYSGRIARAPLWMRQIGMEWVFRLLMEPKRMWKRYIIGNPMFLYRVYRWNRMMIQKEHYLRHK